MQVEPVYPGTISLVYLLSPFGSGSSFFNGGRSIGSVVSVTGWRNSYVCHTHC